MKLFRLIIGLLCYTVTVLSAQNDTHARRMAVVQQVIDGYNRHDYAAMLQPWAGWAKLLVTKSKLRKEFGAYYEKYGSATIDTVTYSSKYEYIAKLIMVKEPVGALYFSFIFSDNGKIEGFGETNPPMIYKKCLTPKSLDSLGFSNKVDSLLQRKYLSDKTKAFNGSVLVLDNGQPLYHKHFGYADLKLKTQINDSTRYDLASVSKQFTAVAILQLQASGKLNVADSIQKFIPDFPYRGISIENLLTHTSGLPEYMALMQKYWDKSKFASNYDVVEVLKMHRPKVQFAPNTRFEYCNTGYVLLSIIIEKASGKSYSGYLTDKVFKPLGMSHTLVYNTRRAAGEKLSNHAVGYVYSDRKGRYEVPDSLAEYQQVIYLDAITGDGNINSCTQDLQIWEQELLSPTILPGKLLSEARANHTLSNGENIPYGYGFFLTGGGSAEPLVFHTGGWPGYFSILMNFLEQKKQIVILTNNSFDHFTKMADDIATLLLYE